MPKPKGWTDAQRPRARLCVSTPTHVTSIMSSTMKTTKWANEYAAE